MRIFQITLCCFLFLGNCFGQSATNRYCCIDVAITKEKKQKKIYATIENKVGFPCAGSSWLQSVEKQINESLQSLKKVKKGKYLVTVQYVLDRDSNISDVRPKSSYGYGLEEAVLRVIKKSPKWSPAPQGGRTVKPYRTSAIKYNDEQ